MAERFDTSGRKLRAIDDVWIVQAVSKDGLRIVNSRTDHNVVLPYDGIHNFRVDLSVHDGFKHGILMLLTQLKLRCDRVDLEPFLLKGKHQP
jgi:hypothetical protein